MEWFEKIYLTKWCFYSCKIIIFWNGEAIFIFNNKSDIWIHELATSKYSCLEYVHFCSEKRSSPFKFIVLELTFIIVTVTKELLTYQKEREKVSPRGTYTFFGYLVFLPWREAWLSQNSPSQMSPLGKVFLPSIQQNH